VVKTIRVGRCPPFHVVRRTRAPAAGCRLAAPRLQVGFHEQPDLHSRELWALILKEFLYEGRQEVKQKGEKHKEKEMSGWWLLLIIAIWLLLQAYILPKFGIST